MGISIGSVEIDVVPNTRGIYARLRAGIVPAATRAGEDAGDAAGRSMATAMQSQVAGLGTRIGQQLGQQIAARVTSEIRGAMRDGITQGGRTAAPAATRAGGDTGGAFARSLRARLEAAFRSMPRLDVRLSDTGVDADLARLRARLEQLAGRTVGIDIDAATARAEAADIEERLRRIGAAHPNVAVRADTARARAELAALREEIDRVSHDPARIRVEMDGSLGQRLRAAVQQAQASLPHINIGADTTPAQVEVARLRSQLGALGDQRIGIDIDAATALARVEQISARLRALSASDADVDVRVDATAALAQLATVRAAVDGLDGSTARVRVDTSGALDAILQLSIAVAGVAAIPAIPVLAAQLGSVTAAAVAASVGVGALAAAAVPAVLDIRDALQLQEQAQSAAANATERGGQAAATAARQVLQMEGAQQALASAHRNAARQITQAERGVADAVQQAADASRRAAEQVAAARERVADVVQQAADRQRAAAQQVERAEEQLADAQRSALQAQQDLTQARRDAAAELEELGRRLTLAQLSERDAALSVQEAQLKLQATRAKGSKATVLEQQRAQLSYDQAVQRLADQQAEVRRLAAEKKAADAAGVEGSETVARAQERLGAAQDQVRERTAALTDAQSDAARTQVQAQRDIAAAQQQVAEAQREVTRVQEQGAASVARAQEQLVQAQQSAADSIASAQRQIAAAQLSTAGGTDAAADAQARYQEALAGMVPETRATMEAFTGLRDAFWDWSEALQPAVMPLFTRALDGMRNSLPGLTPFVLEAADAIGDLQDRASRGFQSEGWQTFREDLLAATGPAIRGLGNSLANIGVGLGGVIAAFLPHMDTIAGRMESITGRFADWGLGLQGSPEFEGFLSYASEMAPVLGETLGDFGAAGLDLAQALEPLSGPVLQSLGLFAEIIGWIASELPWLVQTIYLAIVATRLWTLGMLAFNVVANANPFGLIVLAIMALVAAVIYAWNNWDWFRDAVVTAWDWIKKAAQWAWERVLKPTFDKIADVVVWLWDSIIKPYFTFIVDYWKAVGDVAVWLWQSVLSPAFDAIGAIITWWWTNIVKRYFGYVTDAFKILADTATWLWKTILKPTFDGIATVISWWWTNVVKKYFNFVKDAVSAVGDAFSWLYDKGIKPVMGWIRDRVDWAWEKGLKPAFGAIRSGVEAVKTAFENTKDGIDTAWSKLKDIAKTPVRFVIERVYNDGIRKVYNKVADLVGLPVLGKVPLPQGFATGGAVYGAGTATSDSIPALLSNGEHVWTAKEVAGAGGHAAVMAMRQQAAAGGSAYATGGPVQRFSEGGIVGWFKDRASDIGSLISGGWDFFTSPGRWWDAATGFIRDRIDTLTGNKWVQAIAQMPVAMLRNIKDKIVAGAKGLLGIDSGGSATTPTGTIGGGVARGMALAISQAGKPYQWGGIGNPSWDCSGFLGGIQSAILGQNPRRRLWSTFSFQGDRAPAGWVRHLPSVYRIGIDNSGVGHTAGTLAGVNVESRGGDGVLVGPRARGYNARMFGTNWYGFTPTATVHDSGGWLQPGQLGFNGLRQPEAVLTPQQWQAMTTLATQGPGDIDVHVYVGDREITDIVRTEVSSSQRDLARVITAGRRR